jgi:hypothetical protein
METGMVNASEIKDHMEVLGADGKRVGTVDHMEGADKIKLTKNDPASGGHHHLIPLAWVASIGEQVRLSKSAAEVMRSWEHVA